MRRQTFILISILLHLVLFLVLISIEHKSHLLEMIREKPPLDIKLYSLLPIPKPILVAPKIPIIIREFTLKSPETGNNTATAVEELSESLPLKEQSLNRNFGKSGSSNKPENISRDKKPTASKLTGYNNLKPKFNRDNLYSLSQSLNKIFPTSIDTSSFPKPNSKDRQDLYAVSFGSPGSDLFRSGRTRGFGKGDGKFAKGGGAVFNSYGYDITPWAKRVVYRIKKNWIIPATANIGIKGQVNIYTIIKKGGELELISIKQSSQIHEYDKAAFFAIKTSSPFPTLPANFPYNEIEGLIIFHYN